MCLDYKKVDLEEIKSELNKWITSVHANDINKKAGQDNPLKQHLKKYVHLLGPNMGSINTLHGQFIERNFHKWVQCIPNWGSLLRPKFNYQEPISNKTVTKEIDNISFNKKTGQLLIFELKRNYDTKYHNIPRSQAVYDRLDLYNRKRKQIINKVRNATGVIVKNKDCSILLINVYGQRKDWHKNVKKKSGYDPEVYTGDDIGKIFGQCLVKFMHDLDEYMINQTFGSYDAPEFISEQMPEKKDNELERFIGSSLN